MWSRPRTRTRCTARRGLHSGRLLDPITQDSCAFFEDHALFDDYTGVVLDLDEGKRIGASLGDNKAVILRNHGLLTVGHSVDAAVWSFITMDRTCQAQLLAEAAGTPVLIEPEMARKTHGQVGSPIACYVSFQPLWDMITREQPDLFDWRDSVGARGALVTSRYRG